MKIYQRHRCRTPSPNVVRGFGLLCLPGLVRVCFETSVKSAVIFKISTPLMVVFCTVMLRNARMKATRCSKSPILMGWFNLVGQPNSQPPIEPTRSTGRLALLHTSVIPPESRTLWAVYARFSCTLCKKLGIQGSALIAVFAHTKGLQGFRGSVW